MTFRLDRAAVARLLKSADMAKAVGGAAKRVADAVPDETIIDPYETDRAAALVVRAHPKAMGKEATDGALIRAAAAQGLEVRAR